MKKADQLVSLGQTEQTKQRETTYKSSEETFVTVWRGLQAARFVSKDDVVGGTDYKYWRAALRDLSDEELMGGLTALKGFTGVLTWSEFHKLCAKPKLAPAHKPYKALPVKPLPGKEVQSRIRNMKEELGLNVTRKAKMPRLQRTLRSKG